MSTVDVCQFYVLSTVDVCQFYVLSTVDGSIGRQCWDTVGQQILFGFGLRFVPGDPDLVDRIPFQLEPISHD